MNTSDPFAGLPDTLKPYIQPTIPMPWEAGDAMAHLVPYTQAQSIDDIIKQLVLDRPLTLFIPRELKHPEYEYRIINTIPQEIAQAHNKGFRQVTNPEVVKLFTDLVAGTDKDGKAYRPIVVARPVKVGDHIRNRNRLQLQSLYAGMDPRNRDFGSKYADNIKEGKDSSAGQFSGAGFRIRLR